MLDKLANVHKSVTMWFNAVAGSAVVMLPTLQEQFPQLHDYMDRKAYQVIMGGIIVGNILLSLKTTKSLKDK